VLGLVMIAECTATAQNAITLGGTGSNTTTFTGTESGNWTLSLTADPLKGITLGRGGDSGPAYSITEAPGPTVTGTLTGANTWSIVQCAPLTFSYGAGGSLLEGNLELLSLTETGSTGQFDTTLVLDLTNLSGSPAHVFSPPGAVAQLGSLGAGQQLSATLSGGELYPVTLQFIGPHPWHTDDPWNPHSLPLPQHLPDPAPEPTSMLLVGSGLLVLGGLVRRRRGKARCS
jgi:hypothetical protein